MKKNLVVAILLTMTSINLKENYYKSYPMPLIEDERWVQKFQHKTVEYLDMFIEEDTFVEMSWREIYEWSLATVVKEKKQTKTIRSQLSKIFKQKSRTLKRKRKELEKMYILELEALSEFDIKIFAESIFLNIKYYICCFNVFIGLMIGKAQDLTKEKIQLLKDHCDKLTPYLGEIWCQIVKLVVKNLKSFESRMLEIVIYSVENQAIAVVTFLASFGFIIVIHLFLDRVLVYCFVFGKQEC